MMSSAVRYRVTTLALVVLHLALLASLGAQASPSHIEAAHMAAGLYSWAFGRFDVFHVNPPLVRMLATTPVALCNPKCDWRAYSKRAWDRCEFELGNAFCAANGTTAQSYFRLARWTCIPFSVVGALACRQLATDMFGHASGLCALTLWCLSPTVLGFGASMAPDLPAAATGVAALWSFRRWVRQPTWCHALTAGALLGLAPLTKLTWLVAFALWPGLWLASRLLKARNMLSWMEFSQLSALLIVSVYVVNLGYAFDGSFQQLAEYQFISKLLSGQDHRTSIGPPSTGNRFAGTWLGDVRIPLPADLLQGIDTQRFDFEMGVSSYLRGRWSDQGWWYFYLYALLLKVPLGTGVLAAFALFAEAVHPGTIRRQDACFVLIPGVSILALASSQTGVSLHARYVIPALPFLFVWTSRVAWLIGTLPSNRQRRVSQAIVGCALIWSIGSTLLTFPHCLSYFNELAAILPTPADDTYPRRLTQSPSGRGLIPLIRHIVNAGPRHGPRHLLGSNVDWGQDVGRLKRWLDTHPEITLDGLACDAFSATVANLSAYPLPPVGRGDSSNATVDARVVGPLPGWYALNVNSIFARDRRFRYLLCFKPAVAIGFSIHIYHITEDQANRVRQAMGLPLIPGPSH